MKKIGFWVLFLFSCAKPFWAQTDIDIKTFSADDGIGSYSQTLRDKQGYTWFLDIARNRDAIYRFDGRQFKKLLCGTFLVPAIYGTAGRKGGSAPLMLDHKGNAWFGSSKGIYRILNGTPLLVFSRKNGLLCDSIISMVFDKSDNLWILTLKELALAKHNAGKYDLVKLPPDYSFPVAEYVKRCSGENFACIKLFIDCDSTNTVWCGVFDKQTNKSLIYRTSGNFTSQPKITRFNINEGFIFQRTMGGGLFLANKNWQFYYCDSTGKLNYLDKKFDLYLGKDKTGNHYFRSKADRALIYVHRDRPDRIWNFGRGPAYYQFPKAINDVKSTKLVKDELWLLPSDREKSGYVIRGDGIFDYDSLYPNIPLKDVGVYEAEEGVFWAHKWQMQLSYQLNVSDNSKLIHLSGGVNGSSLKHYLPEDSTFYYEISQFKENRDNYFSFRKNIWTPLMDSSVDYFAVKKNHCWFQNSKSKAVTHKHLPDTKAEVYRTDVVSNMIPDSTGGCFILKDTVTLCYLRANRMALYPLGAANKVQQMWGANGGKVYLRTTDDRILIWNPLLEKSPQEVNGLPKGEISSFYRTGEITCFVKGRQSGWFAGGKTFLIDTVLYPGRFIKVYYHNGGRISFAATASSSFVKYILSYDKGAFKIYPLIDSVEVGSLSIASCRDGSDELLYSSGTKIYRYSEQLKKFYFIKNLGRNFGYIWTADVIKNKLYVSGWSSYIAEINLDKCPVMFPVLSFGSVSNNGIELDDAEKYSIAYGDKFIATYIAIEKLNQSKIVYQTRLLGSDSTWSQASVNEVKEFANTQPGSYRFEVRTKGESEVWSEPIGFNLIINPPWYRTAWAWMSYIILFFGFTYLIMKLNSRRLQLANKQLQYRIDEATGEIREQKQIIEEKHKDIMDSINYAERIQRSLLATKKLLDSNLKDYFVLYKPKDIVSGDFYWATVLKNGNFALVTADSTGHGVPGAIMSILNIACLKEAVTQGIEEPHQLLNETRRLIIANLKNDGSAEGGKDGMDGSLISFDLKNKRLTCACANNPVWVVRQNELIELKADRMPIASHQRHDVSFTLQTLDLEKGDLVYAFTDGMPDQFGGPKGKKFMYKQLQELLVSLKNNTMETQKQKIEEAFGKWKGNLEQVDDVCIIGVRI